MRRMTVLTVVLTVSVLSAGWISSAASAADAADEAKARLLDQLKFLASDELEGRGVGTAGLNSAAEFLRNEFRTMGLAVDRVNGGAFQTFNLITGAKQSAPATLQLVGPDGKTFELQPGTDFDVCSFAGSGAFEGDLVFAGYGIEDNDPPYNDFAGLNVEGKVVLILRRNPRQAASKARGTPRNAELRTKLSHAHQHKAAAVLFVNDPYSVKEKAESRRLGIAKAAVEVAEFADAFLSSTGAEADKVAAAKDKLTQSVQRWKTLKDAGTKAVDDELMKFGYAGYGDDKPIPPAFHITQSQADMLLKAALQKNLADLEAAIDKDFMPQSAALPGWKVKGSTSIERIRSDVFNVIGVLDGEGSKAQETIVIGAHYDHVGRGGASSLAPGSNDVHNGADDNASGTVALVELARRFAARRQKLPRRLVFIAFTGEELGLLGSAKYVKDPVFPLEQTIAMFNMDMVGRLQDDKLTVFGSGTSPRWEPELKALNEQAGFKLTFKPEGFGPSDHSSFYGKKIPVLHLFTNNHPDYHRPTDDWDKINIDGMYRIVDLLAKEVEQTAYNPDRPEYVEVKGRAQVERAGNRPYFGTIPDFSGEGDGYAITGAAPGSPADKGGLKGGDRIIAMGENKISGLDDFDLALRKFKPGDEIAVTVLRDGKPVTLKVTLDPPR